MALFSSLEIECLHCMVELLLLKKQTNKQRKFGYIPFRWSGLGSLIEDYSDHGATKEMMNPLWARIYQSFDVLRSEWSWIIDPDSDHLTGIHCLWPITCCGIINSFLYHHDKGNITSFMHIDVKGYL